MYELTEELRAELAALDGMTVSELAERYATLTGEPSHSRNRAYLRRRLTWLIQAREFGGLSEAVRERALSIARLSDLRRTPPPEGKTRRVPVNSRPDPKLPPSGTTLVRTYRGHDVRVAVLESGFEWEGRVYRSLSAVAKAVTGQHLSGLRFFGLSPRKERRT
jgi:hypothetical protein